jgi:hypothetical protein
MIFEKECIYRPSAGRTKTVKYYSDSVLPTIYGKVEVISMNDKTLLDVTTDHLIQP